MCLAHRIGTILAIPDEYEDDANITILRKDYELIETWLIKLIKAEIKDINLKRVISVSVLTHTKNYEIYVQECMHTKLFIYHCEHKLLV